MLSIQNMIIISIITTKNSGWWLPSALVLYFRNSSASARVSILPTSIRRRSVGTKP